jgi:protein subunit release factor A
MNALIVEIRAAEGGDDAKILVGYQTEIYAKFARRHCL